MGRKVGKKAAHTRGVAPTPVGNETARSEDSAHVSQAVPAPNVIPFYSDRPGRMYREFSNFFRDAPAFEFDLPPFARRESLPTTVSCEFSEKAIMLTKAALMGDDCMFREIMVESDPKTCKALARGVRNFDQELWTSHIENTAFEVLRQKFASDRKLREVLLSTGDAILAEAAPNDTVWGIGIGINDERALVPSQWCGRNVLGYSLMKVRDHLRGVDRTSDADLLAQSSPQLCPTGVYVESGDPPLGVCSDISPDEDFLRPVSDPAAVRACFGKYGVVGVTGVLSEYECTALITEGVGPFLPDGCQMDSPETYNLAGQVMNRYGVIGKHPLFSPTLLAARLHPRVVEAYAAVHGHEQVFACHDRAAWMRPAAVNSSWDTPFSWPGLHVDLSPRGYYGGSREEVDNYLRDIEYVAGNFTAELNAKHESMGRSVQGVLNLLDNSYEDGGFQCVPGMFGPALRRWVQKHPNLPAPEVNGKYELKDFGADAEIGSHAVRVPCPAGTLILFDATLPHGTKPNTSTNSRAILFLRYLTSSELPAEAWRNRNAALRRITAELGFLPNERQASHLYGPEQ